MEPVEEEVAVVDGGLSEMRTYTTQFATINGEAFVRCSDIGNLLKTMDVDDDNWFDKIDDLAFQLINIELEE